jgi:FkbH-like protein
MNQACSSSSRYRRAVATALAAHRHPAAAILMRSLQDWDKYAAEIAADPQAALHLHFLAPVDHLIRYFRSGDPTWKHLYIGEKIRQYYDARDTPEQRLNRTETAAAVDRDGLFELLRPSLPPAAAELLYQQLDEIRRQLVAKPGALLKVVFIGDCLHLDVIGFLAAACLEDEIALTPIFLTTKSPAELRRQIEALDERGIAAVFYSPFTYEFSPACVHLNRLRSGLATPAEIDQAIEETLGQVVPTLELLAARLECSIFVHNSAFIRRHDGTSRQRLINLLTRRPRRLARHMLDQRLRSRIQELHDRGAEHLLLLDELPLLARCGQDRLGRYYYRSPLQHPAVMGKEVAALYRDFLYACAHLLPRKLVVCDLDNTLWHGIIGEGPVRPLHDRQQVLKRLQQRGIVLAINSKNDPANVHWTGCLLGAHDFVCAQINWDPKVHNMGRIAEQLNLKTKDFIFLDDRPDERQMVKQAFPEIHIMDASQPRTWHLLDAWAHILEPRSESDRTFLYRQRQQRERFIEHKPEAADHAQLLRTLQLRIDIRQATRKDTRRIAELINRTNQFNTTGARTTVRQVTQWQDSPAHRILVFDAADRFGDMGTVCILILHFTPQAVRIPAFVLSCRVFGYGIEVAALNNAKRMAASCAGGAGLPLEGSIIETPHNQPCRNVYADNGFTLEGHAWVFRHSSTALDPVWLATANPAAPTPEESAA